MREIKFRVFDTKQKKFLEIGDFIDETWRFNGVAGFGNIGVLAYQIRENEELNSKLIHDDERFKIKQYTGLKDHKGREIYEGDIIELESTIYLVAHDDENACYVLQTMRRGELKNDRNFNGHAASVCKVVGNLYQNEDLLK